MKKIIPMAHNLLKETLQKDSITIDATCGKGNDTLFLARHSKQVYAFDIQEEAITATARRVRDQENVALIHDSHKNIKNYVNSCDGAIFNLGYLPGSENKSITTQSDSTLSAVKTVLEILNPYGLSVLVLYPGRPEGKRESRIMETYLETLDSRAFEVLKYRYINRPESSYLIAIMKK